MSKDSVGHILNEILGMRKLSARWVPRLLSPDNKRNPKEFLRRFVTVEETWIHRYTPETKQWTSPGELAPKKAKTVPSAEKVMATVFWDSQGVIYIDYLEKGKFGPIRRRIAENTAPFAKKNVLFHHDNAPAHTFALAKAILVELGYELLPHPPCSPDLAPCDFFLFPNLKKSLAG